MHRCGAALLCSLACLPGSADGHGAIVHVSGLPTARPSVSGPVALLALQCPGRAMSHLNKALPSCAALRPAD